MKVALYLLAMIAIVTMVVRTIPQASASTRSVVVAHRPYDPAFARSEVQFHLDRVKRDPKGAIGWRQLASAYLAAGRETDSAELAVKAEAAALNSLKIRSSRNAAAAVILSEALLEQHRFGDALEACQRSLKIEPGNDFAERTLADIYFEIGRYDDARQLLGNHPEWSNDPSGLMLVARQAELTGHPDVALANLNTAVTMASSQQNLPASTVSWFHTKLGDALARNGQMMKADASYSKALELYPASWKALAGVTRLKAMLGDYRGVLSYGEKLISIAPMTDVVGQMEDACVALGDLDGAKKYATMVFKMNETTILAGTDPKSDLDESRGHTHDRMFSVYLADHKLMLPLAQHAATHDLANRKDVYAYDTYAWATYQRAIAETTVGTTTDMDYRIIEAKQCIDEALALGTNDSKILFHAGMIELSLGDKVAAKKHLQQALDINPSFNLAQAAEAKAALASL